MSEPTKRTRAARLCWPGAEPAPAGAGTLETGGSTSAVGTAVRLNRHTTAGFRAHRALVATAALSQGSFAGTDAGRALGSRVGTAVRAPVVLARSGLVDAGVSEALEARRAGGDLAVVQGHVKLHGGLADRRLGRLWLPGCVERCTCALDSHSDRCPVQALSVRSTTQSSRARRAENRFSKSGLTFRRPCRRH